MAWISHGKNNDDLIDTMQRNGLITSQRVVDAMKQVDRANYVRIPRDAYTDAPASIGFGATISAPHMHAHAAENLLPLCKSGAKVLDVGSGSGYTCAVFYHLVKGEGPNGYGGKVVGIEHVDELVDWSKENLIKDGVGKALEDGDVKVVSGDGRQGLVEDGPYDVIHVGAASPTLPQALVDQLARPGRMFIPIGDERSAQSIWQIDKAIDGSVLKKKMYGVMYVPLTDRDKQRG